MDSSLLRGSSIAATYPNPRVRASPAKRAAVGSSRRGAAAYREHAPVYVRHPDGESLWRKGRLLVCDRPTGRCRCLVESVARGDMTQEVVVSGDAVLARDINQPDANIDNLSTTGIGTDNDAAIVNLLRARYENCGDKRIYTVCGVDMVLSINPWESLHPESLARADRSTSGGAAGPVLEWAPAVAAAAAWHANQRNEPHVWTLASATIHGLRQCGGKRAQTICACGVSGSGKSNASELALTYFAGALKWSGGGAEALVCARQVLESFGCAGTCRNPRSSRFTRLVELLLHLQSDGGTRVLGAHVDAFMLERSRIHREHKGSETNFLVFEQLQAASSESLFGGLLPAPAVEDSPRSEEFETLVAALDKLGMSAETQQSVFRVVSAVQELSLLSFDASNTDKRAVVSFDSARVANLLGCPDATLHGLLGSRRIGSVHETVTVVNFTASQARRTCNELAKSLYARLFAWLCQFINHSMSPRGEMPTEPAVDEEQVTGNEFVGIVNVLDLPGLDTVSTQAAGNGLGLGFDHLCSNYADERLHNQFLSCAVEKAQSEYLKEGIRWELIGYPDNGPIVGAMENVFMLLEEQHKRGKHGSNAHFLQALHDHVKRPRKAVGKGAKMSNFSAKHPVAEADNPLSVPRVAGTGRFTVRHYSGEEIVYSATGFREQNEDVAHADVVELALADCCQDAFITELLTDGRPTNARQQHLAPISLLDDRHSPTKPSRGLIPPDSFGSSISSISSLIYSRESLGVSSWTEAEESVHPRVKSVSLSRNRVDREVSPRQTLLAAHRARIDNLCHVLAKSKLHYVRCLVPNLEQNPNLFSERVVHAQLESQGVLQAIRVRRRGFSSRMNNRMVLSQYWLCAHDVLLTGPTMKTGQPATALHAWRAVGKTEQREKAAVCTLLLACRAIDTKTYAVGRTKTFFRGTSRAVLDSSRARMLPVMYTRAQALARGYIVRLRLRLARIEAERLGSAVRIQRWWLARTWWKAQLRVLKVARAARAEAARFIADQEAPAQGEAEVLQIAGGEAIRLRAKRKATRSTKKFQRVPAAPAAKQTGGEELASAQAPQQVDEELAHVSQQYAELQQVVATAKEELDESRRLEQNLRDQLAEAQRKEQVDPIVPRPVHLNSTVSSRADILATTASAESILLSFYDRYVPAFANAERVRRIVSSYRRRGQRQVPYLTGTQSDEAMFDELMSRYGANPVAVWEEEQQLLQCQQLGPQERVCSDAFTEASRDPRLLARSHVGGTGTAPAVIVPRRTVNGSGRGMSSHTFGFDRAPGYAKPLDADHFVKDWNSMDLPNPLAEHSDSSSSSSPAHQVSTPTAISSTSSPRSAQGSSTSSPTSVRRQRTPRTSRAARRRSNRSVSSSGQAANAFGFEGVPAIGKPSDDLADNFFKDWNSMDLPNPLAEDSDSSRSSSSARQVSTPTAISSTSSPRSAQGSSTSSPTSVRRQRTPRTSRVIRATSSKVAWTGFVDNTSRPSESIGNRPYGAPKSSPGHAPSSAAGYRVNQDHDATRGESCVSSDTMDDLDALYASWQAGTRKDSQALASEDSDDPLGGF